MITWRPLIIAGLFIMMESPAMPEDLISVVDQNEAPVLPPAPVMEASPPEGSSAVPPTVGTPTPASQRSAGGNPLWKFSLKSLSVTRDRPLFSASRRPSVITMPALETQPSVAQPSRPLLALLGAIAGENDGIAIFLDTSTKTVFRLKTGEDHLGWTLDTVDRREVTLRRGPESIVLAIPTAAK